MIYNLLFLLEYDFSPFGDLLIWIVFGMNMTYMLVQYMFMKTCVCEVPRFTSLSDLKTRRLVLCAYFLSSGIHHSLWVWPCVKLWSSVFLHYIYYSPLLIYIGLCSLIPSSIKSWWQAVQWWFIKSGWFRHSNVGIGRLWMTSASMFSSILVKLISLSVDVLVKTYQTLSCWV